MPNSPPQKQWWAPVWTGLVLDRQAKHYRQMKSAVWLYLYFLLHADRRTGLLKRKLDTISSDLGISRDMAKRWLDVLRTKGYVRTSNTGRALTIQALRWKPIVGKARIRPQVADDSNPRRGGNPPSRIPDGGTLPLANAGTLLGRDMVKERDNKINCNNKMQNGTLYEASPGRGFSAIGPWTQRELLAHELANALDDAAHINRYRAYGWRYNERLLRQVLNEALAAPVEAIPQGRATLFTNLLHHHARATTQDPLGH